MLEPVILITGSRKWTDRQVIMKRIERATEWSMRERTVLPIMFHGDCDGADRIAAGFAAALGWEVNRLPGFWHMGPAGGTLRNEALLNCALAMEARSHDVFVEAFPLRDGRGTQHMIGLVRKAIKAGSKMRLRIERDEREWER